MVALKLKLSFIFKNEAPAVGIKLQFLSYKSLFGIKGTA